MPVRNESTNNLKRVGPMRLVAAVVILLGSTVASRGASAQAARVGRLPVLAPLSAASTTCRPTPLNEDMRRQGVTSAVLASDSANSRSVSLVMTSDARPKVLFAMMSDSTGERRREAEIVWVHFDADGRVASGSRSAMTEGVPARLSEDRRAGLLPADTAQAIALANALRACGRIH